MSSRLEPRRGGSVRKARERAQAGIPLETSSPPRQKGYDQYQPNSAGNRSRPQMPVALSNARDAQGQIGVAISRPTQIPQWPLAGTIDSSSNTQYQPPAGRGAPPQRPPRPSHVPSMLDGSRLQDPTPTFLHTPEQGQRVYYEDNTLISPTTPNTGSSRPSTVSSVGSIPEFPVPAIPQSLPIQGPRRSGNLGPPPLSRRGASSYYSQASFVSPIPEESPRTTLAPSHLSYASSAAIPPNWSPNPDSPVSPGFQYDDYYGGAEDGRISRGSTQDDSDDRGLIRSASLGKRAKPAMILTKPSADSDSRPITQMPKPLTVHKEKSIDMGKQAEFEFALSPPTVINGQRHTAWPTVGNPDSPLASGTGLMDPTPSTSAESVPTIKGFGVAKGDSSDNGIGGNARESTLIPPLPTHGRSQSRTPSPSGFSRFSAIRRPPRLDIDAVRDAEARGSLTSLPDLIRRATKLAAMMDRGKRPSSRANDLSDFPTDIDLSSRDKDVSPGNGRNSTLSGMLASFPPPGIDTPRDGTPRPVSAWPTGYGPSGNEKRDNQKKPRKGGRRCCGMPCWAFLLTSLILLIVIAAAVVIPLYFLVIKKNQENNSLTPLQRCQRDSSTSCQNGGTVSLSTGSCACICVNGFTGPTCNTFDEGACAATTFAAKQGDSLSSAQVSNATLGDAIIRLITDAQTNFSIPLSEPVLLSRFNAASLSCVSQNALVTFDGQSRRIGAANAVILPTGTIPTTTRRRGKRQTGTSSASEAVGTSASGIIFDTGTPTATTPSSGSSSSTTTTSSNSANPTELFNITQEVLDFSRIAVLYIFQEESLDNAVLAQSNLQRFFELQAFTNQAARNVTIGNGNSVSLLSFTIDLGQGVIGGTTTG